MSAPENDPQPAEAAETAYRMEMAVLAAAGHERASWLPLAETLYEFHAAQAWRQLDYEKFADWLGIPELGIGLRHAYRLIAVWAWAADAGIEREVLQQCDVTKLALVIPSITSGLRGSTETLSDVMTLSRSDLREKYATPAAEGSRNVLTETEECAQCGRQIVKAAA